MNMLTLSAMTKIAAGNMFDPLSRYNAMMLIAELNEDEATDTPYKPAIKTMAYAARADKLIESVRVAALIGINRHIKSESRMDDADKATVMSTLGQLVTDAKPPDTRSREGHDWMRRRALEGLVAIFAKDGPPPNGSFLTVLANLLAETDSTMELRAEAAEALLHVKIVAPPKFDSAKMAADIGRVAVDAYHRELDTSLSLGRKIHAEGMKYYFTLVDLALAALNKAVPSPNIATLQEALTSLKTSTVPEVQEDPTIPVDPFVEQNNLYNAIAQSGAKFEALVTGKPENEILPKRDPPGGNTGAIGGGGYGAAGYGAAGYGGARGGYGATGRGGYGAVPAQAPPTRGYGAYGGAR
jgi:hypothetical protein